MNRPLTFCGLGALGLAVVAYFGLVHNAVDAVMEHTAAEFDLGLRLEPAQRTTQELPAAPAVWVWHAYDFPESQGQHRVERQLPPGVTLQVLGPDGGEFAIDPPTGEMKMTVNGRHKYLLGSFGPVNAGEYSFEVIGDRQVRFLDLSSVNPIAVFSTLAGGCFGIVVCGVLALAGLVMLIVGLVWQGKGQPA